MFFTRRMHGSAIGCRGKLTGCASPSRQRPRFHLTEVRALPSPIPVSPGIASKVCPIPQHPYTEAVCARTRVVLRVASQHRELFWHGPSLQRRWAVVVLAGKQFARNRGISSGKDARLGI